ncbi:hypothetical protein ACWFMI_24590 [Nocardiopsis terrae]|uniref:hypothetical protein n=1 Tax=Streptomyces sp. NPDC057554 TaxID=3350538 RepID=UPI0036ACDF43
MNEPQEPPLTTDERAWFAQLLAEGGPGAAFKIADHFGIDLDEDGPPPEDP